MEHIVCFGDSITEFGYDVNGGGWVARLAQRYLRRANVVNCGLCGYNTRGFLEVLQDADKFNMLLPSHIREPLFATLLLGSNDMAVNEQHVPLGEFIANMEAILKFIHREVKPKHGIFLMTPPPVDEDTRKTRENTAESDRTLAGSRLYRSAVLDIVANCQAHHPEYGVQLVDTHNAILLYANPTLVQQASADPSWEPTYDSQAPWTRAFEDGLHLNVLGGEIFFACLTEAIRRSPAAAQLDPETMRWMLPIFSDVPACMGKTSA